MEKKKIIKEILGGEYHAAGKNFQMYSKLIDYVTNTSDALTLAELLPSLSAFLSRPMASAFVSNISFLGVILFPFAQIIKAANAYETGHRMYSYRSVAYTITAWAYDRPLPSGSQRILSNARTGLVKGNINVVQEYNKVWMETSANVIKKLKAMSTEARVPEKHLKAIIKAFSDNSMDKLCRDILMSFEDQLNTTVRNMWRSNYSVCYPH